MPPTSPAHTPTKGFDGNFKLEPNLSVKDFVTPPENGNGNGSLESVTSVATAMATPTPPQRKRYKKRVQFTTDALNGYAGAKNKAGAAAGYNNSNSNNNNNNNFASPAKTKKQEAKATAAALKAGAAVAAAAAAAAAASSALPEVLDCRIAEKIKSELEACSKESLPNALCLKKAAAAAAAATQHSDEDEDEDEEFQQQQQQLAAVTAAAAAAATAHPTPTTGTLLTNAEAVDASSASNGQLGSFHVRSKNQNSSKKSQAAKAVAAAAAAAAAAAMMPPNSYDEPEDDSAAGPVDDEDEDDEELDEEALAREMKMEQNFVEEEDEHDIAFRSQQSCRECSISHDHKLCPLRNACGNVTDAVDLAEWIERRNLEALAKLKADAQREAKVGRPRHVDDEDDMEDMDMDESSQLSELETKPLITFAEASVPAEFELHNVEPNVTGVFARTEVRAYTKLGPLIGQPVQTGEVREGSDMKWIFEMCEAGAEKSYLLCCDNPNASNWLRFIRPAPSYEERNVNLVSINRQAYFVSCRDLRNGMELLYWSDDCNTMWRKKHTEKISKALT